MFLAFFTFFSLFHDVFYIYAVQLLSVNGTICAYLNGLVFGLLVRPYSSINVVEPARRLLMITWLYVGKCDKFVPEAATVFVSAALNENRCRTNSHCTVLSPSVLPSASLSDWLTRNYKKVKGAHTRLPSVGFLGWSRFLAVRLQVTWVIIPSVKVYFSDRSTVTLAILKRAATSFAAWWTETLWAWTVCLRLLPDSVADAIWTRDLLRWV